jgi:hypothetical protein
MLVNQINYRTSDLVWEMHIFQFLGEVNRLICKAYLHLGPDTFVWEYMEGSGGLVATEKLCLCIPEYGLLSMSAAKLSTLTLSNLEQHFLNAVRERFQRFDEFLPTFNQLGISAESYAWLQHHTDAFSCEVLMESATQVVLNARDVIEV